jgi:hypothetical protein
MNEPPAVGQTLAGGSHGVGWDYGRKKRQTRFECRASPRPYRTRTSFLRRTPGCASLTRGSFENADVDVRGTAGLETGATFMRGCEPKDHG